MAALLSLCYNGDVSKLQHLIETGDITLGDFHYYNGQGLILACEQGHLPIVKYLLAKRYALHDLRSDNNYAFRMACYFGHLHIVEFLVRGLDAADSTRCNATQSAERS